MSIQDTFYEECEDLLEVLAEGLNAMENGSSDGETLNAVFRAVHSMKGGAGAFGLDNLVEFSHVFETVLDGLRDASLTLDSNIMSVLQRASDQLAVLVESCRDQTDYDVGTVDTIKKQLGEIVGASTEDEEPEAEFVFDALGIDFAPVEESGPEVVVIKFAPTGDFYRHGHDPLALLSALTDLGTLTVSSQIDEIPQFDDLDLHAPWITWDIHLETTQALSSVEEVFEFVDGLCELTIALADEPDQQEELADSPIEESGEPPAEPAVEIEAPEPPAPKPASSPQPTSTAQAEQKTASQPKTTLRVDLDRVDRLINTVGELIINQAMIAQRIDELTLSQSSDLDADLEDYKHLARELQEGVMAIRAQPVKPLFQRMSRIVREAADATGKRARLVTEGETTEVDKTVIERLSDPLTHMIRNAIDHGLEGPETRLSAGKSETGTITLSASHKSGSVMIEISDDGAGLNRPKIREIAISKGLIPETAELTNTEIDNLLFMPGFSTAKEVSALSGRGVGMDVVKNAVSALGGKISITSKPGAGSTFSVVLPLTLAVMDGMVVSVAGQMMVVPITSILETVRPEENDVHALGSKGQLLSIRGSYLPIVDVAEQLGLKPNRSEDEQPILLLVETDGRRQCALAVDGLHDQRQVVIKGLDGTYGNIHGISAATILGDGKIALIIDTDAIAGDVGVSHHQIDNSQEKDEALHESAA